MKDASRNRSDPVGQAGDVGGDESVISCVVAELSRSVLSPAFCCTSRESCACVAPSRDGGNSCRESVDVGGDEFVGGGVVAELSGSVFSPAFHCAVSEQGACVIHARCDGGNSCRETGDVGGDEFVGGGVVTKLSGPVDAPAFSCAACKQRAGVGTANIAARSDGGGAGCEPSDIGWGEPEDGGVVAEFA